MTNSSALRADAEQRTHFVGIAGFGMSALAQYLAMGGCEVSGSDRAFDQGQQSQDRAFLEALGVRITPQDASGVTGAQRVVASTAVEAKIPDLIAAAEHQIPVLHRAELLAEILAQGPSLAVAGTSGKSTTTGMAFSILQHAGKDPGLITGGDLVALRALGSRGNAWRGQGPVVAEADESDGTLIQHHPQVGVLLNLHRDHMPEAKVLAQYERFADQVRGQLVVSDETELAAFGQGQSLVFGLSEHADIRATDLETTKLGAAFKVEGLRIQLPMPGRYNVTNALAAIAATRSFGVTLDQAAEALEHFQGVSRRFQRIGTTAAGVSVIDDYAHNPMKIQSAIRAAQGSCQSLHAYFQPHGFGPTKFMREELVDRLVHCLRTTDTLWLGEIFYAGGTVTKDISSEEIVEELTRRGLQARFVPTLESLPVVLASNVKAPATVLIMGARDPNLPAAARSVFQALSRSTDGAVGAELS